jgi:hypothetical protein
MREQNLDISHDDIYQRLNQIKVPVTMRRSRRNDYEFMVARDFMEVVRADSVLFDMILHMFV